MSCMLHLKRGFSDRKSSTKDKTDSSIFQVENLLASCLQGSLGRFRHTAGPHKEFLAQASKGRQRSVSIPPKRADSDRSIATNLTVSSKLHSSSQKTLRVALPPSSFNWIIVLSLVWTFDRWTPRFRFSVQDLKLKIIVFEVYFHYYRTVVNFIKQQCLLKTLIIRYP